MFALACMQPRDRAEAARTVFLLSIVAGLVTLVATLVAPRQSGGIAVALGVVVPAVLLMVLAAFALTRTKADAPLAWTLFPLVAIPVITVLDLATDDSTVAAQVFLFFPVLYGSFNLPRRGAAVIAVFSAVADVVLVYRLLAVRVATVDASYVVAALLTSAAVLVYSSERRAALLELLRQQAAIDSLTGLATRRVLDQTAHSVLASATADTGTSLILIDLDHFKAVNDRFGHLAGDEVLVAVAQLLGRHVRPDSVISRMGGDEIAVLLPGCDRRTALHRAEQMCAQVREHPFAVLDRREPLRLTASLGVAHAPSQAGDLRSLYAAADAALYNAKEAGRDRVAVLPAVTPAAPLQRRTA